MTLPTGTISMANLNVELQRPANYPGVNLNEYEIRRIAGTPSAPKGNPISLSDCQGKNWVMMAGTLTAGFNSGGNFTGFQAGSTGNLTTRTIPTPYGTATINEWLTTVGTNNMKITIDGVTSQDFYNYLNYLINASLVFGMFAGLSWQAWDSKNNRMVNNNINYGQGFGNGGVYSVGLWPGTVGL